MNLIEGLIEEMNRCKELLQEYEEIGSAGVFGAAMIKAEIVRAEKAISMSDTIGMMTAYEELKACQ